jgi:hypothetical protein
LKEKHDDDYEHIKELVRIPGLGPSKAKKLLKAGID